MNIMICIRAVHQSMYYNYALYMYTVQYMYIKQRRCIVNFKLNNRYTFSLPALINKHNKLILVSAIYIEYVLSGGFTVDPEMAYSL